MHTRPASDDPQLFAPDRAYAWRRLALSLVLATVSSVGMWAVVVVLPIAQLDFGVDRAAASLPYTLTMLGFAIGTLGLGRLSDRVGIALPMVIAGACLGLGFIAAAVAPNVTLFAAAHVLVGTGAACGFAPMIADISHWFVRRRSLAVVLVASGNYLAGTFWPLAMNGLMPLIGWRHTFGVFAAVVVAVLVPGALFLRRRPSGRMFADAEAATRAARLEADITPRSLILLLAVAGFACCAAMSMPQVQIVAYCGDLGYGTARGAQMLSLMLFLGIASRIGSGLVADRIGGAPTLLIGSLMQGVALLLYLYFTSLPGLYAVSGIFGLFQGGIVPMYAVICRELLPPREAGAKIGIVISATIFGMAFGGWADGLIYDLTGSYRMAFLHGIVWNVVNLAAIGCLLLRSRRKIKGGLRARTTTARPRPEPVSS